MPPVSTESSEHLEQVAAVARVGDVSWVIALGPDIGCSVEAILLQIAHQLISISSRSQWHRSILCSWHRTCPSKFGNFLEESPCI